jgi:hypothetical protein
MRGSFRCTIPAPQGRVYTREAFMSTEEEMKAELERLKAENAALKNRDGKGLSLKVSEKGGVSVYGLGRFPVTLYQEQWLKLLDMTDDIRSFIKEHDAQLKKKQ